MRKYKGKSVRLKTAIASGILILAGCSGSNVATEAAKSMSDRGDYYADNAISAVSQDSRAKFLILHYTVENDVDSLKTLSKKGVSAHYLVTTLPESYKGKPVVTQLVPEDRRAWHAGVSSWQERTSLNDSSIGIEIVNKGFTDNNDVRSWYPYTESQVEALIRLTKDIVKRHGIKPNYVLGHSDIAPLRKQDPGKLFPWQRLAEKGVGAWPDAETVNKYLAGRSPEAAADVLTLQKTLSRYGYSGIPLTGIFDKATQTTIAAFQMHFRPANISGQADAQTEAIAKALVEKYIDNPS